MLELSVPRPRDGNAIRLFHHLGLGCSQFARRYYGNRCCFPFLPGTEMFQFPEFPLPVLFFQTGVPPHDGWWVSPFRYPRIKALSAAPRGFSQPHTSFIGAMCQGIHRWLFVAWNSFLHFDRSNKIELHSISPKRDQDARACSAVLKVRHDAYGARPSGPARRSGVVEE